MAEEKDKDDLIPGGDFNEDASTPEPADDAADDAPASGAPAKAGKFDRLTQ